MSDYPLHDKLKKLDGKNITVSKFIDWLRDQDIELCTFRKADRHGYVPITETNEHLLGRFFDIDADELRNEKDRMYQDYLGSGPKDE